MSFESISYTSTILWHFVRGQGGSLKEKENNSFNILLENILSDDNSGKLLPVPKGKLPYHKRQFILEKEMTLADADILGGLDSLAAPQGEDVFELNEPRSLCFADVPINSLPIHINSYFGVGLGFRKEVLISKLEDLKPVDYFPRKTFFTLKNSCKNFKVGIYSFNLKEYAKIPSADEPFEQIYHEREWRTFKDFVFSSEDLAFIFFPSKEMLLLALKEHKIKRLIMNGVSLIAGEDLYSSKKEKSI